MEQLALFSDFANDSNKKKKPCNIAIPKIPNLENLAGSLHENSELKDEQDDIKIKNRLSASKISTYEGCSMAYFLKYIMHEKVPENIRLTFGKSMHSMLESFYDLNYKSSKSFVKKWLYMWHGTIAGDFLKGKQKKELMVKEFRLGKDYVFRVGNHINIGLDYGYDNEPDEETLERARQIYYGHFNLGSTILKRFYDAYKEREKPIATELALGRKKNEIVNVNGHQFIVILDRIDKINGNYYIGDYKTDMASPGHDSFILHRSPQFTLYSNVFRMLFGVDESAMLYYHLRSGEIFETHRSQKDYDYLFKLIDKVSDGIENKRFVPFYGFHCKYCELKSPCEKYAIDYHGGPRLDLEERLKKAKKFEWDLNLPSWMSESHD